MIEVRILGSSAGGGFPQWNCTCTNCSRLRAGTLHGKPRSQAQVAVGLGGDRWCLLNASPDLRFQIEATADLQPQAKADDEIRSSPIAAVVLTSGDLDNVLGLLTLREFQPLEIYATRSIRQIITSENTFFRMLQRVNPQAAWHDMKPGEAFELGFSQESVARCELVPLTGEYPEYVSQETRATLSPEEAVVALKVEVVSSGRRMIYCPALPGISDDLKAQFEACDLLLLDGTFWSDDELTRIALSQRTSRDMGHLPISGPRGSLEVLSKIQRPKKAYIHINNTNPILDEESAEFMSLTAAGWGVAEDGMQFSL
jgi:pyrroloquinoline quinone biosynthesis protein B